MDKYLLEILKNVNTIIIPGLGALTITNHETGEIMFMSYLKHDDGKLTSYIMENEGLEELEAKNLISKYVREIERMTSKGDSYDMFQFGSFYKNGDEIDFKNYNNSSPSVQEEKKIIVKKEEVKSTSTLIAPEEENILVEKPKNEEPKVENVTPTTIPEKEDLKKKELNILEKEEQLRHVEKLAALRKAQEEKKLQRKNKKERGEKSKRGIGFWMLMAVIVLIVAGGSYFGLNYNELKQHVPFLADKEEVVQTGDLVDEEDTLSEVGEKIESDFATVEEEIDPIEEEAVLPEESISDEPSGKQYNGGDLPFHVIVGAFSSEDNARKLGEKFTSEGYSVKVGQGGGMTLVSIKSFSTREEARKGLSELKVAAPKGWIYEWK